MSKRSSGRGKGNRGSRTGGKPGLNPESRGQSRSTTRIETRRVGGELMTSVTDVSEEQAAAELDAAEAAERAVKEWSWQEVVEGVHEAGYRFRLTGPRGLQVWGVRLYHQFKHTSEVRAAKIEGSEIARTKPEGSAPTGGGGHEMDRFRREWLDEVAIWFDDHYSASEALMGDDWEAPVGEEAHVALQSVARVLLKWQAVKDRDSYSPDRSLVRSSPEWKRRVATDERTSAVVGRVYGCSPGYVRKLRQRMAAGDL